MNATIWLIVFIAATLVYAFWNGMNDSGGLVAAAISSRSLSPRSAFVLAAIAEFLGPFMFGTAVAATIGRNLIQPRAITSEVLLVGIGSAIVWNIVTGYLGLPSSSTHALIGGLTGAVVMQSGWDALINEGFFKIVAALIITPFLGSAAGYGLMKALEKATENSSPHVNWYFRRAQVFNVLALALSHGTNDGQKSMGLIALALSAANGSRTFNIPLWATGLCAAALTLGVSSGGYRIIRTMGEKIYRLRPVHATAAQTASALVVLGSVLAGAPVSTSQVVSSAIIGVGTAERISGVRWQVATQIVTAWFITIPSTALLAAMVNKAILMISPV